MPLRYCYWSVATDHYGALMESCIRSARKTGVFKEFHVLCDRPLEGAQCYDAFKCDKSGGFFKLHYLKVGMSRLPFDAFVWIDADSLFVRNPVDILETIRYSPIHVPLEANLADADEKARFCGIRAPELQSMYNQAGVLNAPYQCQSAFWIVRKDAIDLVYELAFEFANRFRDAPGHMSVDLALGYSMQMLCANPDAHLLLKHSEIWASDEVGYFRDISPTGIPWKWQDPVGPFTCEVNPAIIHLPHLHRNR